jgi:branched-chain amino acid aminotransferase
VDPAAAHVSVFDRGFLYGDSVFETLRTYGGQAFALDDHLRRLEESARRVLIPMPVKREQFAAEVREAVRTAGFGECLVRIVLTRGRATVLGLDPSLADTPLRVVIVLPLESPAAKKYEQGISAITYRTQRVADGTAAAGAKVGNYLTAVLAMHEARRQGAEEALLVDAEERLLEGATSNVFGVVAGHLVTPPEDLGILAGITRARLFRVADALGMEVDVRPILVDEIWRFEEVFICSSIRELLSLIAVDGRAIGSGRPGPVFQRLLQAFRQLAAQESQWNPGS